MSWSGDLVLCHGVVMKYCVTIVGSPIGSRDTSGVHPNMGCSSQQEGFHFDWPQWKSQ